MSGICRYSLGTCFLLTASVLGSGRALASLPSASVELRLLSFEILPSDPLASVEFLSPWNLTALAESANNLGALDQQFQAGTGFVQASGTSLGAASFSQANDPATLPTFLASISGNTDLNAGPLNTANTTSLASLDTTLSIHGGSSLTTVQFRATISGSLNVATHGPGQSAGAETIFSVSVDGAPVTGLQFFKNLAVTDSDTSDTFSFASMVLTGSFDLSSGDAHTVSAYADDEIPVTSAVPEASSYAGAFVLLAAMALRLRGNRCSGVASWLGGQTVGRLSA